MFVILGFKQGYHIGECLPEGTGASAQNSCEYTVDPNVSWLLCPQIIPACVIMYNS